MREVENFKGVEQKYSREYYKAIREMMNNGVHFLVKMPNLSWMGSGGIGEGDEEIEKSYKNQYHYVIHADDTINKKG